MAGRNAGNKGQLPFQVKAKMIPARLFAMRGCKRMHDPGSPFLGCPVIGRYEDVE
jgi:hypothetical protein